MAAVISWTDKAGVFKFVQLDVYDEENHELPAECTKFPVETGGVVTDEVRLGNRTLQLVGYVSNTPLPLNDEQGRYNDQNLTLPTTPKYVGKSQTLDIPSPPLKPNVAGLATAAFGALFGSAPEALLRRRQGDTQQHQAVRVWRLDDPQRVRAKEAWDLLERAWSEKVRVDVALTDFGLVSNLVLTTVSSPRKTDDGDGLPFLISLEQIRVVSAKSVKAPKPLERMGQPKKPAGSKAGKPLTAEEQAKKERSLLVQAVDAALLPLAVP
jgi:hypothetical protein